MNQYSWTKPSHSNTSRSTNPELTGLNTNFTIHLGGEKLDKSKLETIDFLLLQIILKEQMIIELKMFKEGIVEDKNDPQSFYAQIQNVRADMEKIRDKLLNKLKN